jgi:predicted GIY-YIG superfamily endonuclease
MVVPAKAGIQSFLRGQRAWKITLIEEMNPEWKDLSAQAF